MATEAAAGAAAHTGAAEDDDGGAGRTRGVEDDDAADRCASCGTPRVGRFCHECGERTHTRHELSLGAFLKDGAHAVFGVDGRLPRTFRALVAAPGTLTAAYVAGRRRVYLSPIQTFLLANLLYFLSIPFTGTSTFTTPLRGHMEGVPHSRLAVEAVRTRMVEGHDFREYERRFDAASEQQSRSLVIVMVPLFALAGALLFARSRHYFVEHLVFALHFYAFLLLLLTALTVGLDLLMRVPAVRTSGLVTDRWISLLVFASATVYVHGALRRAFGGGRTASWLRAIALAAAAVLILVAYRTILFFTVYFAVR